MGDFFSAIKNFSSFVWLPLWSALLLLPLAGPGNAVRIAVIAGLCVALWRLVKSETVANFSKTISGKLSRLPVSTGRLTSLAQSPAGLVALVILLVLLPLFLNDYYRDTMTLTCLYIVLALGLNIVVGQAGLLNLGYVAFYAIGAYTYAILSTSFGVSFWPGIVAGALTASLFPVLVGLPTLRLRGDYFAIVTLGLGEITRIVFNNWDSVTGGPNGISKIGRPALAGYLLSGALDFYYLILAIAVFTVFAMHRLMESRIGRAWIAIREDETAAEAMGINTFRLKLLAFVIGSAWAGAAGVFFAAKMAFVSPESFTFSESVLILCMVVLGGMGSIPGIVLGAFLLITLPEVFREFQDYRMLAFGAALVTMMVFKPQGLLGAVKTNTE
ncbi:MAG: branched-chain amino acid ABC transporter permease [Nitrospirota bacterium]